MLKAIYQYLRKQPAFIARIASWSADVDSSAGRAPAPAAPAQSAGPEQDRVSVSVGRRKVKVSVRDGGGGGAPPKDTGSDGGDGGGGDSLGSGILKVVGAAATGIGAVSAIVAVGGAVLWIRFDQAGIPAMQAVSVQPKQEALVQGGEQTAAFLLIALVAVLLIFFADPGGVMRRVTILAFWVLFIVAVWSVLTTHLTPADKVLLVVLAAVLLLGSMIVALRTDHRFWPLALAIFISSLIFSAASALLIAKQQDFVQAVAVLRDANDKGLTGVYVAATGDKLYIAQPTSIPTDEGVKRAMLDVPREGAVYAVGPLESQEKAEQRARIMLAQLEKNRERNPADPEAASKEGSENPKPPGNPKPETAKGG